MTDHEPPLTQADVDATRAFGRLVSDVSVCVACTGMAHSHVLSDANGPLDARVLFVAEAVGRRGGAVTGVPLTRDESGKRFSIFLEIAGIPRSEVFITNAVLCNPLDANGRNRPPAPTEVARCRPFLARTIETVAAPLIVTLGRVALESLRVISPHAADLRANVATAVAWQGRTLVPMYHPSRQSTLHRPQAAQEDDWRHLGAIVADSPARSPVGASLAPRLRDEPAHKPLSPRGRGVAERGGEGQLSPRIDPR